MRRPLLSHKNSHIVFREKGGSRPSPTHFRDCALHPPHTGHLQFLQTGISASRPWSQPLCVHTRGGAWAAASSRGWKGKGPFGHRKSRSWHWKLHCKDCVNRQRQPMWGGRSLGSHLSLPLGPVFVGCPFRIMPPSLHILLVLAFSSPLFWLWP